MAIKKFQTLRFLFVATTISVLLTGCGKSDSKNDFVPLDENQQVQEQEPTIQPTLIPTEIPQPTNTSKPYQDVDFPALQKQQTLTADTLIFLMWGIALYSVTFLINKSRLIYLFLLLGQPPALFMYYMANISNPASLLINTVILCVAGILGYRQTK